MVWGLSLRAWSEGQVWSEGSVLLLVPTSPVCTEGLLLRRVQHGRSSEQVRMCLVPPPSLPSHLGLTPA